MMYTWSLFGAGAVCAALCGLWKRGRPMFSLLAAVCTVLGVLSGLALGMTLRELLNPVLIVCVLSMAVLLFGRTGP